MATLAGFKRSSDRAGLDSSTFVRNVKLRQTTLEAEDNTTCTLTFPTDETTGTIARLSDIPSVSGFVTLTGSETLTNKTLTTPIISSISNSGTVNVPTGGGTLALVSDIPSLANYVTLNGSQTLTNKTLTTPIISSISNSGTLTVPMGGGTLALVSDIPSLANYVTLNGSETLTNKTLDAATTSLEDGAGRLLKIRSDATNPVGTNSLNLLFTTTTPGLTHSLRFGNGTLPTVNTQWNLDPNGGTIPNTTNSQTISGAWTCSGGFNFTRQGGTSATGAQTLRCNTTSNSGQSEPNSYYFTTFNIPPTTGGTTTGSTATVRIIGAPANTLDTLQNTDALRVDAGNIRTVTGRLVAGNGTLAEPSIRMGSAAADVGLGFYRPANNTMTAVCNGGAITTWSSTSPQFAITGNTTTTGSLRVGSLGAAATNIRFDTFTYNLGALNNNTGVYGIVINFGVTFATVPRVWLSLNTSNITDGIVLHTSIQTISTSTCTFGIWNTSHTLFSGAGIVEVYWLAISA